MFFGFFFFSTRLTNTFTLRDRHYILLGKLQKLFLIFGFIGFLKIFPKDKIAKTGVIYFSKSHCIILQAYFVYEDIDQYSIYNKISS